MYIDMYLVLFYNQDNSMAQRRAKPAMEPAFDDDVHRAGFFCFPDGVQSMAMPAEERLKSGYEERKDVMEHGAAGISEKRPFPHSG